VRATSKYSDGRSQFTNMAYPAVVSMAPSRKIAPGESKFLWSML